MFVLSIFKSLKRTYPIRLKKQTITNIYGRRDFASRKIVDTKDKCESNRDEIYNECIKNGLSSETIFKNDWLFNLNTNYLSSGFMLLAKWNPKQMEDLFVLLQLPLLKLSYFTRKTLIESSIVPHGNRVYYFANNFEKKPEDVCYHMVRYKFLFTRNFSHIHQMYHILLENNVNKNDIWKDAWIFMYSIEHINHRIALTKTANLVVKPWMLRCKLEVFQRTIMIHQENRVILNKDSTAQYLAKRLKVSEKTIRFINSKYPTLLRVSPTKLKEILDFLLKEGYRPIHILRTPRVFTHSISTLQERLTELRDLGCEPNVTALCKNKTTYQELVDKLIIKKSKPLNNAGM